MIESGKKEEINMYSFEYKKNGDLKISFPLQSLSGSIKSILFFIISLAVVISGFYIEGDLAYMLWIFGGMFFILSFFGVVQIIQPLAIVVSKLKGTIAYEGRWFGQTTFQKSEIESIDYVVEKLEKDTLGVAGKADWPTIQLKLKNGKKMELLTIKVNRSNLTRTYEEEIEAKKIIEMINKVLGMNQ